MAKVTVEVATALEEVATSPAATGSAEVTKEALDVALGMMAADIVGQEVEREEVTTGVVELALAASVAADGLTS